MSLRGTHVRQLCTHLTTPWTTLQKRGVGLVILAVGQGVFPPTQHGLLKDVDGGRYSTKY